CRPVQLALIDAARAGEPTRKRRGRCGNSRCKRARGHETVAGSYRAGVREVRISGLLERSKTVCEGPSPEKPMHNAQGRPGKCCGGGGYSINRQPAAKDR